MTHDELQTLLDGVAATLTPSWQIPRPFVRMSPADFPDMAIDWQMRLTPPQGSQDAALRGLERELRMLGDRLKS